MSAALGNFSSTRFRISAAAFLVKVIARTSSGLFVCCSSFKNRLTSSVVFPDPAGACTMKERAGSSARFLSSASAIMGAEN